MGNNLIKSTQRKRNNESDAIENRRKQASIFKLNGHCFDELFDYLSLEDLHSLSLTCKSMQQLTGEFYLRNYSAAKINCLRDGIYLIDKDASGDRSYKCISIPGFMRFVTWIAIENNIVAKFKRINYWSTTPSTIYHRNLSKFEYVKKHSDEFKSVKKISLTNVGLNKKIVGYILKILPNIEVLQLTACTVTQDLYDILLKYCKNVRHIELARVTIKNKYKWLLHRYEKLECLELGVDYSDRIEELGTFFERNPNIRKFSCDSETFMANKDAFLNSKVKLDTFEFKDVTFDYMFDEKPLWELLDQLHTRGFYNRLHVNTWSNKSGEDTMEYYRQETPEQYGYISSPIQYLKGLSVGLSDCSLEPLSTHLIEFAETGEQICPLVIAGTTFESKNEIFVENLINVERLYLYRETHDIELFIGKLKNLKKFKLFKFKSAEILQLDLLNSEREKLAGAQKVTIYVPDPVYLATKWATKNGTTNFSLIEMKRIYSYKWNRCFYHWAGVSFHKMILPAGMK